jgi:uncharacterized protein (TIGR02588 family)
MRSQSGSHMSPLCRHSQTCSMCSPPSRTVTVARARGAVVSRDWHVEKTDDRFLVSVEVHNRGDAAAAEVQVAAESQDAGGSFATEQTIDFLGGGETQQLTFVVPAATGTSDLRIAVTSFAKP